MPEIKRKPGETFEAFFRRYVRTIQRSGKIIQAKKIKYLIKPKSRNERRKEALMREQKKKELEYLKKIGKLEEDYYRR